MPSNAKKRKTQLSDDAPSATLPEEKTLLQETTQGGQQGKRKKSTRKESRSQTTPKRRKIPQEASDDDPMDSGEDDFFDDDEPQQESNNNPQQSKGLSSTAGTKRKRGGAATVEMDKDAIEAEKDLEEEIFSEIKEIREKRAHKDATTKTVSQTFKGDEVDPSTGQIIKTSTACWWCKHKFDTTPVLIPYKRENVVNGQGNKTHRWYGKGRCCSFNCAKTFNGKDDEISETDRTTRSEWLTEMRFEQTGKYDPIYGAQSWKLIDTFGGCWDIATFRKKNIEGVIVTVKDPQMVTEPVIFEEKKTGARDEFDTNTGKHSGGGGHGGDLRLRRNTAGAKPKKRGLDLLFGGGGKK
jgi:hypothetical protein